MERSSDQPVPEPDSTNGSASSAPGHDRPQPSAALIGGGLILVGVALLVAQQLDLDIGRLGWPFFVIGPGVVILLVGLATPRGSGLAVGGSITTIVGLLLLYQNATDHWESWAYAWALVGPGGSGVGMLLYGLRDRNASMARAGFWSMMTGIGLFAIGFVFFEAVIGISGRQLPLPEWLLPAIVIAAGAVLLARGVFRRERVEEP
ncbi:MAG: hypothetical protein ACRDGV_02970 [Candidatus Limnocylindria bacterium]